MTAMQIAIDGPAGAGKSTTAKAVAKKLGYLYIDTGAMYRVVALMAIRKNVAFDDAEALANLADSVDIELKQQGETYYVFADGEDVSEAIRQPQVGNAASTISAHPDVRRLLVEKQKAMAAKGKVIMDGRDIASVVMPDAECKIFLTASLPVRAKRRQLELEERGLPADLDAIEKEMEFRDEQDSSRAASPLKQTDDAILLDTSNLDFDQVVAEIIRLAGAE